MSTTIFVDVFSLSVSRRYARALQSQVFCPTPQINFTVYGAKSVVTRLRGRPVRALVRPAALPTICTRLIGSAFPAAAAAAATAFDDGTVSAGGRCANTATTRQRQRKYCVFGSSSPNKTNPGATFRRV